MSKNFSALAFPLSWQKKRSGVRRLHLPESQWRTGDCCESGLDSGQQRHPFWNCCQIPAWFQCIIISKKHLLNLLYNQPIKEKKSKDYLKFFFGDKVLGLFFLYDSMFYFQAKVNNASLVGIGYTQTLRPGKEGPPITLITIEQRWAN